jgi:hypothetical protein
MDVANSVAHMLSRGSTLTGIVILSLLSLSRIAMTAPLAQPASDEPTDKEEQEARDRYQRGREFYLSGELDKALAEFLASKKLRPSYTAATSSAALTLQRLKRYDEALEMFEALLRDFGSVLPANAKQDALRQVDELRQLVGLIEVDGAEPGAAIAIDGRQRGDYPLPAPVRVSSGSHTVRVFKEGFEPVEARVAVAGGKLERVSARLRPLSRSGRLRIAEQDGQALEVWVDGSMVGKAPWEGLLAPGKHVVALRGEGNQGTAPVPVSVEADKATPLTLVAEELAAALRIEPTPVNASVAIDSVTVGQGIWEGRLRSGSHVIEVAAEGFVSVRRQVSLDRDKREVIPVVLERDRSSPLFRKPSRFTLELMGAAFVTPSFGGDIAGACDGACSLGPGYGATVAFQGGFELGTGFGFGLSAGYLTARETVTGRTATLMPEGLDPREGTVTDTLKLRGFLAGVFAEFSFGERYPLRLRLGAGGLVGSIVDEREGTFPDYSIGPVGVGPSANFLYVDPEVRVGLRLGAHVEVMAGLDLRLLIRLSRPTWDETLPIPTDSDGVGKFSGDALLGPILILPALSAGARYDF